MLQNDCEFFLFLSGAPSSLSSNLENFLQESFKILHVRLGCALDCNKQGEKKETNFIVHWVFSTLGWSPHRFFYIVGCNHVRSTVTWENQSCSGSSAPCVDLIPVSSNQNDPALVLSGGTQKELLVDNYAFNFNQIKQLSKQEKGRRFC